ncbi:TetR/AcrR family transcriptional regulator [Saxibacter everestensis]|uniref:TetR/AcrR family transcriptional regulator n=1 Tax=Saxibacter everestensis TaxID=2909229 RepID=A0ABY8QSJ6_9MICO|nr:TetR/AcrR family transcriptional regulator [Brevibacteriaceae bacterium ZFBP1038]
MSTARGTLSADLIVRECLKMLDDEGPAALTFRRIGKHLGVDPTALYRHFRNKDELILAIADSLMEEALDGFVPGEDWMQTIRELLRRSRSVYMAHPHAAIIGTIRVTRREGEMRIVETILDALAKAGFEPAEASRLYRVLDDLNLAFAGLDAGFRVMSAEQQAKDVGAWSKEYALADQREFPRIAAAAPYLPDIEEDPTFELALELMLSAIAHRAEQLNRR